MSRRNDRVQPRRSRASRKEMRRIIAARKRARAWVVWATYTYEKLSSDCTCMVSATSDRRFLSCTSIRATMDSGHIPDLLRGEIRGMDEFRQFAPQFYWSVNQGSAMEFGDEEGAIAARLLCPDADGVTYGILRIR